MLMLEEHLVLSLLKGVNFFKLNCDKINEVEKNNSAVLTHIPFCTLFAFE